MKDKRFEKIYEQGIVDAMEIWVDKETGVNYLFHRDGYGGGLTPLLNADGKPVGSVYYRDIDNHNRSAEYGIFIGEESARGKGLGTETARLFTQFGVDTLHLGQPQFCQILTDYIRLILSHHAVIDVNSVDLIRSERLREQRGGDRGIDAAGNENDDLSVLADAVADHLD